MFDTVYSLASADRPLVPRTLSVAQRNELKHVLALLPLLYCDLNLPFSTTVYCSDASPIEGGVVYADFQQREFVQFLLNCTETRVTKG